MRTMSGKDALVDLLRRENVENVFYFNIGNQNLEPPKKFKQVIDLNNDLTECRDRLFKEESIGDQVCDLLVILSAK